MAVQKSELQDFLTEKEKAEITALEKRIDHALREQYAGNQVWVTLSEYPSMRVKKELTRRYTDAGWTINFRSDQSDQRDCSSVVLE